MRLVFEDQTFSFELLRTVGYAPYGGADIGECLVTASQIRQGDFESWHEQWSKTARRVHALADSALHHGKRVSAREAYLRASNYYRTAEFFLHGKPQPRPTLMVHGGYDSIGEELYLQIAAAAIQRGYHCLTFEGPGQGALIREQHLPFRPDWEQVVTPVVDSLLRRPEVEPAQIALMGISRGGYLAPRAAAFEHRLAALIANDGMYTFHFSEKAHAVTRVATVFGRAVAQYTLKQVMQRKTGIRWAISRMGCLRFKLAPSGT